MDTLEPIEILNVISRWVHIMTAIAVAGGTIFVRFVLQPAAKELPDAEHAVLREAIARRWRKFVALGIVLFLASGLYNYLVVGLPRHHQDGIYHALMGLKITLAFVVFFVASALAGRSARFEALRRQNRQWLLVLVSLILVIVLISSFLKVTRPGRPAADPARNLPALQN